MLTSVYFCKIRYNLNDIYEKEILTMSMINKEIGAFSAQAYLDNNFKTITKEDVLGKWSIFFFYPADFTFVCPPNRRTWQISMISS